MNGTTTETASAKAREHYQRTTREDHVSEALGLGDDVANTILTFAEDLTMLSEALGTGRGDGEDLVARMAARAHVISEFAEEKERESAERIADLEAQLTKSREEAALKAKRARKAGAR